MEFQKSENAYFIRLDRDDEVISSIIEVCAKNDIKCGIISGIGAAKSVKLGILNPETKKYSENSFDDYFEICSLTGDVTQKNGMPYLHLHCVISNKEFKTRGGHLVEAIISATAEITILETGNKIDRFEDEKTGLNILKFD